MVIHTIEKPFGSFDFDSKSVVAVNHDANVDIQESRKFRVELIKLYSNWSVKYALNLLRQIENVQLKL